MEVSGRYFLRPKVGRFAAASKSLLVGGHAVIIVLLCGGSGRKIVWVSIPALPGGFIIQGHL